MSLRFINHHAGFKYFPDQVVKSDPDLRSSLWHKTVIRHTGGCINLEKSWLPVFIQQEIHSPPATRVEDLKSLQGKGM